MYIIEWTQRQLDGGVGLKQYFDINYAQYRKSGLFGGWYQDKRKGYKYKTAADAQKDIRAFGFVDCKVISLEENVGEILADEIKKNLLENITMAEAELTEDEYTVFLDDLIINLATIAEDCTKFVDAKINDGTTVLPIVVPAKKKAAKKVARVVKKAPKKKAKKKAPKKKPTTAAVSKKLSKKRAAKKRAKTALPKVSNRKKVPKKKYGRVGK